jgi:hypothetical protein
MDAGAHELIRKRLWEFEVNPASRSADAVAGQIALRIDQIMAEDGPLRPIYEEFEIVSKQHADAVIARFPNFARNLSIIYTGGRDCAVALEFNVRNET